MFEASAAWALLCAAAHVVSAPLWRRQQRLTDADKVKCQNIAVAAAHSVVMAAGAFAYMIPRVSPRFPFVSFPRITPNSSDENFYCEIMIGYLVYDGIFCWQQGEGLAMLLHHALGMGSHTSMRYFNIGGPYMMWVHFAEGSTPFLHLAWFLKKFGAPAALTAAVQLLFVALFFACRIVSSPLCLYSFWKSAPMWPPHAALHLFVLCITVAFVVLNYFWWVLIIRRVIRTLTAGRKDDKGE